MPGKPMKPLRLFALAASALVAGALSAAEISVFAAASLSDALREIAGRYELVSGDQLRFNLAASSALARQIKEGAPADLFFSADEAKMDELAQAGLLAPGSRVSLLSNTLAIVSSTDGAPAISKPTDLGTAAVKRLALAETQTVPAGIYAKDYLLKIGLWPQVADKIVPTENVRACLAAVEAGNVDAAIVYKTDALISKQVRIAFEVPAAEGPRISYPLAVIKDAKAAEAARKFAAYLGSAEGRAIFAKYGFLPAAR